MDPLLVLTGGAALAALLGALRQRTSQLWREQSHQARELGLRVTDLGRWVGRPSGVHVVVQVDIEPHDPWSVRAKLPFQVPRGFSLGSTATGRDGQLLRMGVESLVARLTARGWRVELGPAVIVRRPRQLPPFTASQRQIELGAAVKCVVALVRRLQRRYRRLVDGGDTPLAPSLRHSPPVPLRVGEVDGVVVTVVGPQLTDEHWRLEVRARLAPALPYGTRVRSRGTGAPGAGLGDLVLDHVLRASSPDPGEVARRLARDDVRGPVLDVLAAHPSSELRADEVVHVVLDGALDVEAAVRRVVELVRVLRGSRPTADDHATA